MGQGSAEVKRTRRPFDTEHVAWRGEDDRRRITMSKRARKRRDRNKKGANHGKKPNT